MKPITDVLELKNLVGKYESYILDEDLKLYIDYLTKIKPGQLVVDLGTGWGKSVISFGLINPEARIITIDDGSYPIQQRFASNKDDYIYKILERLQEQNVSNVCLRPGSLTEIHEEFQDYSINLLHVDLMPWKEVDIVKAWFPKVELGGLLLLRNYDRMKEGVYNQCLNGRTEKVQKHGLIQVFKRIA